jgi:hypothetical protein
MATAILPEDIPRFTVQLLLICIDHNDTKNLKVCAKAVLRSAFDHLFDSYSLDTQENGEAMSTMIACRWDIEEAERVG